MPFLCIVMEVSKGFLWANITSVSFHCDRETYDHYYCCCSNTPASAIYVPIGLPATVKVRLLPSTGESE